MDPFLFKRIAEEGVKKSQTIKNDYLLCLILFNAGSWFVFFSKEAIFLLTASHSMKQLI